MRIRPVYVVLFVLLFVNILLVPPPVLKACARASIEDYLNQQYGAPNGFEPSGWNVNGTAAWLDVRLAGGWNTMKLMGNLGIGNGSIATFGDVDSLPANQSDPYFMGADVSQQPLDPIRELNLNIASPVSAENNTSELNSTTAVDNSSEQPANTSKQMENTSAVQPTGNPDIQILNSTGNQSTGETTGYTTSANDTDLPYMTPENQTFATYHPISVGAPANDLLYEHPLATSVSMYCRLIGLQTPGGVPVNIGMKCLGYGY